MNKRRGLKDAIKSIAILSIIALLGLSFLACDPDKPNTGGGGDATWTFDVYDDSGEGGTSVIELLGNGTKTDPYIVTGNLELIDGKEYGFAGVVITPDSTALSHLKEADSIQFKVKGDGKNYRLEVRTSDVTDYNYYQEVFSTTDDEEEVITIYYEDLTQGVWGDSVEFNVNNITGVAIVANTDTCDEGEFAFEIWDFGLPRRIEITSGIPANAWIIQAVLIPTSENVQDFIDAMLAAQAGDDSEAVEEVLEKAVAEGSGEIEDGKSTILLQDEDGRWIGTGSYNLIIAVAEEFILETSPYINLEAKYYIYDFSVNAASPKIERSITGTPSRTGTYADLYGSWECTCEDCAELDDPCSCSIFTCNGADGNCNVICDCWVTCEVTVSNVEFIAGSDGEDSYLKFTFTTDDEREDVLASFIYSLETGYFNIISNDAIVSIINFYNNADSGIYYLYINVETAGDISVSISGLGLIGYEITQFTGTVAVTAPEPDDGDDD